MITPLLASKLYAAAQAQGHGQGRQHADDVEEGHENCESSGLERTLRPRVLTPP